MKYEDLNIDPEKFEKLVKEDNDEFENVAWPLLRSLGWSVPDATPEDMA